jgi:antitoxin HicB
MNVLYPAEITFDKDDNRYFVRFPDISEAITEGGSREEAFFNASETLTLAIEGRIEEGISIPQPSECKKNQNLISPSVRAQAALLIRWAKLNGDHTTSEIARSLNTSWPAVSRLENPKHWPSLRQLEKIANVLGQQLIISMEPLTKENH